MDLTALLYLINDLLLIILVILVLKGKADRIHKLIFFFLNLCLLIWSVSLSLYYNVESPDSLLIIGKLNFLAISLGFFCLYYFSKTFPKIPNILFGFIDIFAFLFTLLILFLTLFSNKIIQNEIALPDGGRETVFGSLYFLYVLHLIIMLVLSLINLFRNFRTSNQIQRLQIKYFILGLTIAILVGITTNILLPLLGIFQLQVLGPSATIIMSATLGILILRHQLLDTRLVLGKATYYLIAGIPAYFTFFILAYIYESIYGTSFNTAAYLIGIPVAIFFTMFVNFFNKYIAEYTDSHLINPGYNPLLVLEQLREQLAATLDAEKIVQETLFMIARTIRPDFQGIIIIPAEDTNRWISVNYKREKFENPEEFKSFVFVLEKAKYRPLTYEQILSTESYPEIDKLSLDRTRAQMEKYSISAVIPLNQDYKTTGLLILGQKEASAPYTNQELKFLKSISTTVSLAIGRALLYQEIQIFNQTLQQKVNTATSELRQKNKDLSAALIKLEEVRRQEKDMLDVMGHELRTPISIARNALLTLKKDIAKHSADKEKILKYTDMAIESVRREIGLVEAFLSTTKLEADRMQVEKEKISLTEVVNTSIEAHNNMAVKNKTQLIFNPPSQDILVIADKLRIQEVMDNFLNNAIKYTGVGNVEIQIYKDGANGWVDVKDSGIGISEEDLQKLGRKFFRARTLYNKSGNVVNPSGTGLGLFVSFNLIELMNGQRKIVSKVGEGSTFSFGLPLASNS